MSNAPVDVSKWNLFRAMPVAIIAACGPVVGGDTNGEGGTDDSDPTTPTDPSDPTIAESTNPTTPSEPPECYTDADCDYAYTCQSGQCYYDPNCYCGVCPYAELPPGFQPRCSPPAECYSDADCGYGEICRYNYCEPEQPACEGFLDLPILETTIDVAFAGDEAPIGALAAGDLSESAGTELVVARGAQIEVVVAGEGSIVADMPDPIVALATGDVDGDGEADIVAASDTEVRVWLVVEGVVSPTSIAQSAIGVRTLAVGDRTGDGFLDVFARAGEAAVMFPGAMGAPLGAIEPIVVEGVRELAVVDADADGRSDVAWSQDIVLNLVDPDDGQWIIGYSEASYVESMLPADFSGDGVVDLVAIGRDPSSMATITGPILASSAYVTPQSDQITDAAAGEVDGDGFADLALLIGQTGVVRVRFGAEGIIGELGPGEPFGCMSDYASGLIANKVVLADTQADGTVDIAVSDGLGVRVLQLGSGI